MRVRWTDGLVLSCCMTGRSPPGRAAVLRRPARPARNLQFPRWRINSVAGTDAAALVHVEKLLAAGLQDVQDTPVLHGSTAELGLEQDIENCRQKGTIGMDVLETPEFGSLNEMPSNETDPPREDGASQSTPSRVWHVRQAVRALSQPWDIGHLMGAGVPMAAAYRVVGLMGAIGSEESTRTLAAMMAALEETTELLDCGSTDERVGQLRDALVELRGSLRSRFKPAARPSRFPPGWSAEATETTLSEAQMVHFEQDEIAVERGRSGYRAMGTALARIEGERLYRGQYATFGEYVVKHWELTPRQARRLIEAAEVAENVASEVERVPANEAQALALVRIQDPADQRHVWEMLCVEVGDGPITSRMVRSAVGRFIRRYTLDAGEPGDVEARVDDAAPHEPAGGGAPGTGE